MQALDSAIDVERLTHNQRVAALRFVRIRHYGLVSSTWKRGKLQDLQLALKVIRTAPAIKTMLRRCPCCKTGTLITLEMFGQRGPPKLYLVENKAVPVA